MKCAFRLFTTLALSMSGSAAALAQHPGWGSTLSAGATSVVFSRQFGGGIGAVFVDGAVERTLSARWGVALGGHALSLLGGADAIALCAPGLGGGCISYSSPNALAGGGIRGTFAPVPALRLSLGIGGEASFGGAGPTATSAATLEGGGEWRPRPTARIAPVVALRAVRTIRALAGMRTLLLPSVGVAFR